MQCTELLLLNPLLSLPRLWVCPLSGDVHTSFPSVPKRSRARGTCGGESIGFVVQPAAYRLPGNPPSCGECLPEAELQVSLQPGLSEPGRTSTIPDNA